MTQTVVPERTTPRIDATDTCQRCQHTIVYDEVAGWMHTKTTIGVAAHVPEPAASLP
jgi:hypothetical protein